jgi:predicted phage terminase large subunit-like protein
MIREKAKSAIFLQLSLLQKNKYEGIHYVIAADIARRTPDQTIEKIIQYCRMYHTAKFAFEKNQFQEIILDNLTKRAQIAGVHFHKHPITNKANKQARIEGLEALVTQGQIVFSRRHKILLDQLRQFPLGKHDDGPERSFIPVLGAIVVFLAYSHHSKV